MKYIFLLLIAAAQSAMAQTTVFKKIGQRHDIYNATTWKGVDSFRWDYNASALLTQQTALKEDASGNWNNFYRYSYTLNANDQVTVQVRENWNGSMWVNNTRYTYDIDANNDITQVHYDTWNGTNWITAGLIQNSGYNAQHNYTLTQSFIWNGSGWDNYSKDILQYYPNGVQIMNQESYDWNAGTSGWDAFKRFYWTYYSDSVGSKTILLPDSGGWKESTRELYTYLTAPLRRTMFKTQSWDTSVVPATWKDDRRTSYTYNPSFQITLAQRDKNTSIGWLEEQRYNYIYNGSNQLSEFYDELYLSGWENNTRRLLSYTGTNLIEEKTFTGSGSNWNEDKKLAYLYDANDLITYRQIDTFNGAGYFPNNRDFYYYNSFTVNTNDIVSSIESIQLYPNPAKNNMNLNIQSKELFQASIRVIDINGKSRMIITSPILKGKNHISIDVSSLAAGNYLIQLVDGEKGTQIVKHIQVVH